jgi:hypothetical protein
MDKKRIIEYISFSVLGVVALLFWTTELGTKLVQKMNEPVSNWFASIFLFCLSLVFLLIFIWLRRGTQSWYRAEGRFTDRRRAFMSRVDGPLAEYVDKNGKKQVVELPRMAVYLREPLKLRVSGKDKAVAEGPEWVLIVMAVLFFASSLIAVSG